MEVLSYRGGRAGVSAVPGSGKTLTLSLLAGELIQELARRGTLDQQEVLIVTFSRTAVQNFRSRLRENMKNRHGAMPHIGYAVRTLHSLAHEIVRARPSAVNLDEDFAVVEERPARKLLEEAVEYVVRQEPDLLAHYYKPELMAGNRQNQKRARRDLDELAAQLLRDAKQFRLDSMQLKGYLEGCSTSRPLCQFIIEVYLRYQQVLTAENALDYDDLMRLAVDIVDADAALCARLQKKWPYILEDEAQDSSLIQEALLKRLTAESGNWVRMGDPNQAINTSFNGSVPGQLQRFLQSPATYKYALPQSGRCHLQIMGWANDLIRWSHRLDQRNGQREGLVYPLIEPTDESDPQPNPVGGQAVFLYSHTLSVDKADREVIRSLGKFVRGTAGRTQTVAVLTPTNYRGSELVKQLVAAGLSVDDSLLQVSRRTTVQVSKLEVALQFVVNPDLNRTKLVWERIWKEDLVEEMESAEEAESQKLEKQLHQLSDFLEAIWNRYKFIEDWMMMLEGPGKKGRALSPEVKQLLAIFHTILRSWSGAVVLPIDEVILMLGQDLFSNPEDLALAHRVALHLGDLRRKDQGFNLRDCQRELRELASGRSRNASLLHDASLYSPEPGRVTVSTFHSAKGLEWDRVYLVGVNDYEFPWDPEKDSFRGNPYYVRDDLSLAAEGRFMLQEMTNPDVSRYIPGLATHRSKCQTVEERLRLFYVGITRARRSLGIYCDSGIRENNRRSQILTALAP